MKQLIKLLMAAFVLSLLPAVEMQGQANRVKPRRVIELRLNRNRRRNQRSRHDRQSRLRQVVLLLHR